MVAFGDQKVVVASVSVVRKEAGLQEVGMTWEGSNCC